MGPRTGRAAGYCAGFETPGYADNYPRGGFGMGYGRGRGAWGRGFGGGGRGWRNRYYATGLPGWRRFGDYAMSYPEAGSDLEKEALQRQAEALQSELDFIKKRLSEIKT